MEPTPTTAAQGESPQPARLHVAWRITIVFAVATAATLLISELATAFFGPDYDRGGHALQAVLRAPVFLAIVVAARHWLDRRSWSGIGLQPIRQGAKFLLLGFGAWLIPAMAAIVVLTSFGWVDITVDLSLGELVLLILTQMVLVFLLEAFPEEVVFRGYILRNIASASPLWAAVMGQSVIFAAWGFFSGAATTPDRLLLFLVIAYGMGYLRVITGSVWTTVGFHLSFQTVAQLLIGEQGLPLIVSDPLLLQLVAFGLVPFTVGIITVEAIVRPTVDWKKSVTDPVT